VGIKSVTIFEKDLFKVFAGVLREKSGVEVGCIGRFKRRVKKNGRSVWEISV
jgi:hypothetical protein